MSDPAFEPTVRAFLPGMGAVLDGKYRIEKVIGKGGMGIVYAAHHELLGERVALKLLLEEVARNPQAIARFLNEARAAAKIKNDHVARVMDVGTLEKSGVAFIALEYLEGQDLAQILEERGRLSVPQTADYVLQALEAIAAAHALGIVHRDLKPANLFLAQQAGNEVIKVLDFGISKVQEGGVHSLTDQATPLTSAGAVLGSPFYIPPEQLRNARNVDARADVWATGVILYELLTGTVPFTGETVGEVFSAIIEQAPVPPTTRCPELPVELDRIILKCLSKLPEQRYPSVAELAADLALFAPAGHGSVVKIHKTLAKTLGASSASLPDFVAAPPVAPATTSSAWGASKDALPAHGKRSLLLVMAIATPMIVVIAVLAGLLFLRSATPAVTVGSAPLPMPSTPPPLPAIAIEPEVAPQALSIAPLETMPSASAMAAPSAPPIRKPSTSPSAKPHTQPSATPPPGQNPIFYPQ